MHLTAIRLAGFKSFADNTTFPVDAPLTGIIGPNGCGKSNIIDAVRWVLGETAAKQLRGQAMTDVIFAGSKNRRAGAQASVTLHFDNSDGKAGGAFAAYAELTIARKVQSDGQSQYSINGKRVRRRDIVELLQGSGVGARSYAVIEQGMISRIIEAKPEELRGFIEEAAGIALYKTRRKESEARMSEARDHLVRHDDRLQQLGKQRDKLAQEAETAKLWRALQAQAEAASHQLQSWQYHQLHRQYAAAQEQYSRDRAALNDLFADSGIDEAQIAALEEKLAAAQTAHHIAENEALQSAARLAQLRRELESGRQQQQHLAQNARDQQTRIARLQQQHSEDREQAQHHQAEIARLQSELAESAPALDAARLAAEAARAAADEQRHQLDAQRERRHHAENHHYSAAHRLSEAQQQLARLEQRLAASAAPAEESDDELEQETLQSQHDTLAETLLALEDAQAQHAADLAAAQQQHDQLQAQTRAAQTRLAEQQAALATLHKLQPAPPAQSPELASAPQLLDHLHVVAAWQSAIGRYLGERLHAALGAEYWQSALAHGAPQLARGNIPAAWQAHIESDADLHPWLGALQPLAAHDTDITREQLAPGVQYLTLDGSVISDNSVQPAASGDDQLARQQQIHDLEAELQESETTLQTLETALESAADNLARARAADEATRRQQQQSAQQQRDLAHRLALLAQQTAHRAQLRAQQQRAAEALAEDIAAARRQQQQAQEEATQAAAALAALPPVSALESAFRAAHDAYQQADAAWQQQQNAQRASEAALEQHRAHLVVGDKQAQRLAAERLEAEETLAALQEQSETLALELEEKHLSHETREEEHQQYEQRRAQAARAVEEQAHHLHREQEALRERQHQRALAEARLNHHQENLAQIQQQLQRITAELLSEGREPLAIDDDNPPDEAALTADIREYKQRMEALGAVNLAAIADYDSAVAEYQHLDEQCRDLRQTLELLEEAIAKLDQETRSRLTETLDVVNLHFASLFPLLFRGGEAELAWTAGDILDAGITIAVRPPGKKVKNLSVLSGGEKALTALALVFALFRLNPAPFCLLDEVDAPLDDANVGRLSALLREMAGQTQFIVITHRKRTMQTCDHLIGVTMSEPGVSRLVAVQFGD